MGRKIFPIKLPQKEAYAILLVTGYSIKRVVESIIKIIKVQNNIMDVIGRCIMLIY